MIKTVDTKTVLFKTLQTYLCENVWNMPLTECRRNIVLRAISKGHSRINTVDLGHMSVDLPYKSSSVKKAFYVYAADKHCMGGIIVDTDWSVFKKQLQEMYPGEGQSSKLNEAYSKYVDGWYPLKDYLNLRPFDLRIHGYQGRCLYRDEIFIMNHPYMDMLLIAVEVEMANAILSHDDSGSSTDTYDFYDRMYMSIYYDSDYNLTELSKHTPIISCYHPAVGDVDAINEAYHAYADLSDEIPEGEYVSEKGRTICFINGRESTPSALSDIAGGQYIELVTDPDIICNIEMDLRNRETSHIYRSSIDSTYKYIVHIPKDANPEQYIITHNTCDIFIRPAKGSAIENAHLKGRFVHRFNTSVHTSERTRSDGTTEVTEALTDYMITQITHNDFGVSEKLLQPYAEYIGSSEFEMRVVIRRHSKTHKLDVDANFLNVLYSFDDETILKFLVGDMDKSLYFWRAEHLEGSQYAQMLTDVPGEVSDENLTLYAKALGYYNSLSILTPRVTHAIKRDTTTRTFSVNIPVSMLSCSNIYPLVYINGIKIDDALIEYVREYQFVKITLLDEVAFNDGDYIEVELMDKPDSLIYPVMPTAEDLKSPILPYGVDFDLYEIITEAPTEDYIVNLCKRSMKNCGRSFSKLDDPSTVLMSTLDEPEYVYYWENDDGERIYTTTRYVESTTPVYSNDQLTGDVLTKRAYVRGVSITLDNEGEAVVYTYGDICKKFYNFRSASGYYAFVTKSAFRRITELANAVQTDDGTVTFYVGETITSEGTTTTNVLYRIPDYNLNASDPEDRTLPIINSDWSVIIFLNGKELVENIDYKLTQIKGLHGVQNSIITFSNLSYLKLGRNDIEIYVTSDRKFMDFNGFMHVRYDKSGESPVYKCGIIEEVNPMVYWFDRLCTLCIDGVHRSDIYRQDGYIFVTKMGETICRQGGLYLTRGLVPREARLFLDEYYDETEDITKLTAIVKYLKENAPVLDPELEVIPHSHHITSITMAAIVKDVLLGKKTLTYESDPYRMLEQVPEYLPIRTYDAAQNGVVTELTITGAGVAKVNTTYTLFDTTMQGLNRKWENKANRVVLWWNCASRAHRWEIKSMLATDQTVYYYANDKNGDHDPWKLTWKAASTNFEPIPTVTSGGLDLTYIDLFPSYSSDLHTVLEDRTLRQMMKALFPIDTIRDGDTVV